MFFFCMSRFWCFFFGPLNKTPVLVGGLSIGDRSVSGPIEGLGFRIPWMECVKVSGLDSQCT